MMHRYLAIRKHMTEICMRQWNAPHKQELSIILINVLLRPNVVVFFFLVTYSLQKESNLT